MVFLFFFLFFVISEISLAATLYIQPSVKNLNVGDVLTVGVYVESQDQAINAASGKITWDNSVLKYLNHSKSESIFNFWVKEPELIDNELNFEGVAFNPGYQGAVGKILTVNFKAIKSGEAKIDFLSGSVLANNGEGTNVLRAMRGGKYEITPAIERQERTTAQNYLLPKPAVTSQTHPDSNQWYSNNNPFFEWKVPLNVEIVRVAYSKESSSFSWIDYSPPISNKKLENVSDGTYYFAVQFKNKFGSSEIAKFKFNVDSQPPEITEFFVAPKEEGVYLKVAAVDAISGLEKAEIYINDTLFSKEYFLGSDNKIEKLITGLDGSKKIGIVVGDKAGNEVFREETVTIESRKSPVIIEEAGGLGLFLSFSLIFIVIIIIVIILILRVEKAHKDLEDIRWQKFEGKYKAMFNSLIYAMKEEIKNLDSCPEFSEREKKIYKKFKEIIENSEKEFEKYLKKEKSEK